MSTENETQVEEQTVDTPAEETPAVEAAPVEEPTEEVAAEELAAAPPAKVNYYEYVNTAGLLVFTGKVYELEATDPQPANTSKWTPPELTVKTNSLYTEGLEFTGWFEGLPMSDPQAFGILKERVTLRASNAFNTAMSAIDAGYATAERNTWLQQATDARNFLAYSTEPSVFLSTLASVRNVDVTTLANTIKALADTRDVQYAKALGAYQNERDALNAAKKSEDLPGLIPADALLLMKR